MKKIYGYAFASALMALASCSSDAPEMNEPNPIQGDVVGYIKMNLPEGSRAADGKTYVKFYKNGSEVAFEETSTANVYALKAVPDMVIAFQNDGSLVNSRQSTTNNKDAITPAVYGNNEIGSPVSQANIYHTEATAAAGNAVTVYVDRVVAKVTVDASKATVDMSENKFNDYTIDFTPEYVFVNGLAQKTPMIKSVPTSGTTNSGLAVSAAVLGYEDANGKGSHWTTTDYAWNTADVFHYSLTGTTPGNHSTKQTDALIFERARQSASSLTKDFTHVIVAGKYTLTNKDGEILEPNENWDGTFYVYGANSAGEGIVYFSEADVVVAMGGNADDRLTKAVTTQGGMSTHMVFGTESCLKYDKGYVYYATPVETKIGNTFFGTGVVRNHQYVVNVNTIKGWGTAIPDTDEPIIPEDPKDPEGNYIKLNVVVNPFQVVNNQPIVW